MVLETTLGVDHPDSAKILNNLANLYSEQGVKHQALCLYQKAGDILRKNLGEQHPTTKMVENNFQQLWDYLSINGM